MRVTSVLATIVLLSATSVAVADDGYWTLDADYGDWSDSNNWADGTIADGADYTAYFTIDISGTTILYFDSDRTIGHLEFSDGGGPGSRWWIVNDSSGNSLTLSAPGGTPTITTHTHCTLTSINLVGNQGFRKLGNHELLVGSSDNSALSGDIIVSAGSLNFSSGDVLGNDATLIVEGGADVYFGDESETFGGLAGTGRVAFLDSIWVTVGAGDQTTEFSGRIIDGVATGGLAKVGSGTLTLSGANSYDGGTRVEYGTLRVAGANERLADSGTVQVDDGATFHVSGITETIGALSGSGATQLDGTLRVGGGDATSTSNTLIAGSGQLVKIGAGTLTLTRNSDYNGGTAFLDGAVSVSADGNLGDPNAGLTFDGGTLQVTGTGYASTSRTITCAVGEGTIEVTDPSHTLTATGSITGSGTLIKRGAGTATLAGDSTGFTGLFDVAAGTLSTSVDNAFGSAVVQVDGGHLVVTGGLSACGGLSVGYDGVGTATLSGAGTQLTAGGVAQVGTLAGSSGTFTLSSGTLHAQSHLRVGGAGTGTCEHTDGLLEVDGVLRIGNEATAVGTYNLSGTGEVVENDQWMVVGYCGQGTLTQSGGSVTAADKLYIAEKSTSVGEYNLSDGTLSANTIYVGVHGNSTLNQTGGTVTCSEMRVGTVSDGTGLYEVGGGTMSMGDLYIGGGVGTVDVGPGATLTTSIQISAGGLLAGSGTTDGGSVWNISGTVAPGASPGVLTIDNAYTQDASGTLQIELGGTTPGTEHDVLAVTSTAYLGGTLEITLIDTFELQPGDSFEIVTAAAVSGTFDTVDGADLPSGGTLAVIYSPTAVTLAMCPLVATDLDGDCDVDLDDYATLESCVLGPDVPPAGGCADRDFDQDNDVDLADFAALQRCHSGEGNPANPHCAD